MTGSAGFIGSTFLPLLLSKFSASEIHSVDALTYAGSRENLLDLPESSNHSFHRLNITDFDSLQKKFQNFEFKTVIHFAAETHVDRSLNSPDLFFRTNLIGTTNLLKLAKEFAVERFIHISTDEVYGPTPDGIEFDESAPLNPSSPYAASKAAADLATLSYSKSYDLPVIIIRSTNNYGPRQYPEKLIPLLISRASQGKALPLYGDGKYERDWIHVEDFSRAVIAILECGKAGEIYNVAGENRILNIEIAERIRELVGVAESKIEFVANRPGHDRRYRIRTDKVKTLGFSPQIDFDEELAKVVKWYLKTPQRLAKISTGAAVEK
ncbi:MAG: dTDP-glucose 4,6-dehydratase [candidate division Zixibacteria bacterium]|nr:dTDP-glucose 4,6-dehydratase [candidate division Zixibacteria bacterium]